MHLLPVTEINMQSTEQKEKKPSFSICFLYDCGK